MQVLAAKRGGVLLEAGSVLLFSDKREEVEVHPWGAAGHGAAGKGEGLCPRFIVFYLFPLTYLAIKITTQL